MPQERVEQSRCRASGRNLRAALLGQILVFTVNILSRRIFIGLLGSEYAGFSGLCGHLLNLLSILEPGLDGACIYALYRPIACGDKILAGKICNYLGRAYRKISALTFLVGVLLFPVLVLLSKGTSLRGLAVIWLLSLGELSLSYLFSYRKILPFADQKGYVVSVNGYVFFIISQGLRLFVLLKSRNYLLYLLAGIFASLCEEVCLYGKVEKMYPYLSYCGNDIPENTRREIKKGAFSLFFGKVGGVLCGSVDNMAVFMFLGLSQGAEYSNYTMLLGTCLSFVGIMTNAVSASVGNLGVTGGTERMRRVYGTSFFAIFMTASLLSLSLYFTYPLIIELWMGRDMVLGKVESALFCVNLFIFALRRPTSVFIDAFGLFDKEKYKSLTEAAISLLLTMLLTPRLGIVGVLTGQGAGLLFSFLYEPIILYKFAFKKRLSEFFAMLARLMPALVLSFMMSSALCSRIFVGPFSMAWAITLRILLCTLSVLSVFAIMFFDTRSMRDALSYGVRLMTR